MRRSIDAGTYDDAERLAREWVDRVAVEHGRDSIDSARALDLLVDASIGNGRSATAATLAAAEQSLRLKERLLGANQADTAVSAHNVGRVLVERGEFTAALSVHSRAYSIRQAAFAADDPLIADSLDVLGQTLTELQRFQQAKARLDRALAIRRTRAADSSVALARTLGLVAFYYRAAGPYADAIPLLHDALDIRRRLTPQHPDIARLLQTKGDVHFLMGAVKLAQEAWSEAAQHARQTLRENHPAFAALLRKQGLAAFSLGELAEATVLREAALRVGEAALAPCDPERPALLGDVAISRQIQGDYAEARRLYRRASTSIQGCIAAHGTLPSTDAHATNVFNQGALAREIGDLVEADALFSRAVQIWSAGLGPTHDFVATGLDALAETAAARHQLVRAQRLYERALTIRRSRLGASHPDVAWTLANLAATYETLVQYARAQQEVSQAFAIYRKAGAAADPEHLARLLMLQGDLDTHAGRYPQARESYGAALAARERILGLSHPFSAQSRTALARTDLALGAHAAALTEALDAERHGREHVQFTVRYLPERQALAYAAKRPRALDIALSIGALGPNLSARTILDALIQSRAVVLEEFVARARASGAPDQHTSTLYADAVQTRQRYANLMVKSLQEPVSPRVLERARQQKEDSERALAEGSVEARTEMKRAHLGLADVSAALPRGAALISFVVFDRSTLETRAGGSSALRTIRSYGAFVHTAASPDVSFVLLGSAARIDGLIRNWRSQASSPGEPAAYRTVAVELRRAIWDPLSAHLGSATHTFVVPDGLLNIVNFGALPTRTGGFLVEGNAVIHYMSTERDLVRSADATPGRGLLAVGGAAFDGRQTPRAATAATTRSGCNGLNAVHFDDLPGSRREVDEIRKFWPLQGEDDVRVLSGVAASETLVKRTLAGRQVVHFATHGFFLRTECGPVLPGSRSVGGLVSRQQATPDNPLLLAGLALAGANQRPSDRRGEDDGILTAEEIAGLNLRGTEWAVLSACDTGLGEIKAGEGVLGLRRAFQVAGAKTVIMSLWAVQDQSVTEWMRALYEGRMRQGLPTAEAVRDASLKVLRQRRARGQSVHPFYWAGFVASGDWR